MNETQSIAMNKLVVISGCSGGGKSTLLSELEKSGYSVIPEVGREIVKEQIASGGQIMPWLNPDQFCELMIKRSVDAYHLAKNIKTDKGVVFLDRSILDGVSYFKTMETKEPDKYDQLIHKCRYHPVVFMVPPWKEIFVHDAERKHSFESAVAEYERLLVFYEQCGYQIMILPKASVGERVQLVLPVIT